MTVRKAQPILLIALAVVVLITAGVTLAKPGTPGGTQGAYELSFAIDFTGTGNAAVAAKSVNIVGHVTDTKTGQSGLLHAKLDLNDGRFAGTGTFQGKSVEMSGRVEAADGTLIKMPRLFCNFSTSNDYGRALGQRKGG